MLPVLITYSQSRRKTSGSLGRWEEEEETESGNGAGERREDPQGSRSTALWWSTPQAWVPGPFSERGPQTSWSP